MAFNFFVAMLSVLRNSSKLKPGGISTSQNKKWECDGRFACPHNICIRTDSTLLKIILHAYMAVDNKETVSPLCSCTVFSLEEAKKQEFN